MRLRTSVGLLLGCALWTQARAATYVPQATFPMSGGIVAGLDRDAVGNLYVLGLPSGLATYAVSSYQTQGIQPLLSFDVGLTNPVAFAVEGNGNPDVLAYDPNTGAFFLKRFGNTGAFLGQTAIPYTMTRGYSFSAALDKVNKWVYLAQFWRITPCFDLLGGCAGPPAGTQGFIYQYDFQGNLLRTFTLPGNTSSNGSCYEPRVMAADPQGNLYVADTYCQHLLRYSPTGTLLNDTAEGPNFFPTVLWTDSASNVYSNQYFCQSSTCSPGVAKFAPDGTLLASAVTDAPMGLTAPASVNRGCAWDSRVLYLSSLGAPPLRRFILDNLPTVPAQTSLIGPVVQHSSAASLSWQQSNDPDGDPVLYSVYLGTSATGLQPIGKTPITSLLTASLSFGATYFWQVVAQDSYLGLPIANTTSPIVSFNLGLLNHPPDPFSALAGTATAVTRSTSVMLAWQAATDPDGDPVTYTLYWQAAGGSSATVTPAGTSQLMTGLSFGTTCYWRVVAQDVYGATRPMSGGATQTYLPVFLNNPPSAPLVTGGAGISSQHTLTPAVRLSWTAVSDPDGDPVGYRLALGTNPATLATIQDGTATNYDLNPIVGTTYYWQVTAYDPYGASSATAVASTLALLKNSPPAAFTALSGAGTAVTRSSSTVFSWQAALDPDGDAVTYMVSWWAAGQLSPSVTVTTATSQPMAGLSFGATYYWAVIAQDSFGAATPLAGGATQAYLPVFQNTPPSIPVVNGGAGTAGLHTLTPQVVLSWANSTDAEGDPVSYRLALGTAPTALTTVQDGTSTAYTLAPIFGTTYYWQITAYDPYGGASANSVTSTLVLLKNSPPAAFAALSGTGTALTRSSNTVLSWQTATDPDGDTVTYTVSWWPSGKISPNVSVTTATSQPLTALAFGTTYFWSVTARDGFAGATPLAGGATQAYLPVFLNTAPSMPGISGAAGVLKLHTLTPQVSLSWSNSTDAEGDPVSYRLSLGTAPAALTAVQDGASTAYTLAPAFGTTYYWQVAAYDPYGATSATAVVSTLVLLQNSAPAPFAVLSGSAPVATRDTTWPLSWQQASDADGDAVTYELSLSTSPQSLAVVQTSTAASYRLGFQYGTTYYWQVVARDGFGGVTPSGLQVFRAGFLNTPPPVPSVTGGAGVVSVHTLAPQTLLSWSGVKDAEGDVVNYRLAVGTSPAAMAPVQDGAATAYTFAPIFGTTYYWQVTAYDPFGGTGTTPAMSLLTLLRNAAPEPFAVLTGSAPVATRDTTWPLSWQAASDPDGDTVTYELTLSTSPQSLAAVQTSTATSYTLGFQFGATYYWQVAARDGFGGVASSGLQLFRADFLNTAPAGLKLSAPFMSAPTVKTMHDRVEITWDKVTNAQGDAITYMAYLGDAPNALRIVASVDQSSATAASALRAAAADVRPSAAVADQGTKVSLVLSGLDYYHSYYFQVAAQTAYGAASRTPLQTFNLAPADSFPRAYNYPNPFSPNRGGTHVVFNAPASGYSRAALTIYSEFGQKLYERDYGSVPPGISQFDFDGRDQHGRALMNGSYVGRVRFDGPAETATFFLLVVK